jgi:hypothetical protein
LVVVVVTAGSVIAVLAVFVEVVQGGVVSIHEHSVLTNELACFSRDEKSVSSGSGFLVVVATAPLFTGLQTGVTRTVVTVDSCTTTAGGVLS